MGRDWSGRNKDMERKWKEEAEGKG